MGLLSLLTNPTVLLTIFILFIVFKLTQNKKPEKEEKEEEKEKEPEPEKKKEEKPVEKPEKKQKPKEEKKKDVKKEEKKDGEKKKKFDLKVWKGLYTISDDTSMVCKSLWDTIDKNHSIWLAKLNSVLTEDLQGKPSFINVNKIGGWYRYIEKLGGKAFASGVVLGTEGGNDQEIHMLWVFTGKKVAKELKQETVCGKGIFFDFVWDKLDTTNEKTRKLVDDYLMWNDINGKNFIDGKIF